MATKNIEVIQNDKGYDLNFTLKDADDVVIDITGGTPISFKAQKEGGTALKFTGSMSIVTGTAGTCKYTIGATDFDEVGRYQCEVEVTLSSGSKVITFGDIIVTVKPQLPRTI